MTVNSIIDKIEASRKELLDLSLRNPLLNYRLLRSRGVEVVDEIPSAVFDILVRRQRAMSFLPWRDEDNQSSLDLTASQTGPMSLVVPSENNQGYMLGQPDFDDSPDILDRRHTDNRLQTNEASDRLQSRLLKTYYAANTVIQEQGVNTLFIALGMVEWYESDTSDNVRRAPLILIPVALDRSNARGKFHVSYTGEELGANLSFVEKLRTDFRIEVPDLPDDEDLDIDAYFSAISRRINGMKRWFVDRESVVLGLFSFSRFLMYKDLDPDNARHGPQQSDIIGALFGEGFSEPDPKIGEEDHLDDHLRPEDIHHIVDADSSQALAIRRQPGAQPCNTGTAGNGQVPDDHEHHCRSHRWWQNGAVCLREDGRSRGGETQTGRY